jgi:hypothetical protein
MESNKNQTYVIEYLQKIWALKEESRILAKNERFSTNDVRQVYFNQIMNAISNFYLGILIPYFIKKLDAPFKDGVLRKYFQYAEENNQFANLGFVCEDNFLKTWHDLKKVDIVYNLWIIFEDAIDIIYNKITNEADRNIYQYGNYNKIKNIIEAKLNEEELKIIKEKLQSQYIGINNKYNYIFNSLIIDNDKKNKIHEFRRFLEFFNFLRNTLHTNSRSMKDIEFKTAIGTFKFEKNIHIDFFTLDTLYSSIKYFIEILCVVRDNLSYEGEIINTATTISNKYL